MPLTCCVPLCKTRKGGHTFPKDPDIEFKWRVAIKRIDTRTRKLWKPANHDVVCKDHFRPEDYQELEISSGLQKRLRSGAVPSVFPFQKPEDESKIKRKERAEKRKKMETVARKQECLHEAGEDRFEHNEVSHEVIIGYEQVSVDEQILQEQPLEEEKVKASTSTQCSLINETPIFSVERFKNDKKAVQYYTGFDNYAHFRLFFNILGPAAYHLNYKTRSLHAEDELFLTLIKLRQGKDYYDLGVLFGISERTASSVFNTWINFMYFQLKELDIWPTKEVVERTMPVKFRDMFPDTRVILDATEIPIRKPANVKSQSSTFSTYKNRNTVKVLVGCTPRGVVSYVSDTYGGSTSDRQILERSDLLNGKLDTGDSVMADRGFLVQDLLANKNVRVNTPAMLNGKSQLEPHQVVKDRRIASERIHIERVIGLGKTFKFIKKELHSTNVPISDRIIFVCFMLSNFRKSIINRLA